jgi:hypothetical protein
MPLSDQFRYSVGDRIKNGVTQEEGRVVDIKALGSGALLITVAVFVGGTLANNKTFIQKVGQISGLEWTVTSSAIRDGASRLGLITNPREGGKVSALASDLAAANEPVDRSVQRVLSDRLKAWNPKNLNPSDEEAFADALFDRLDHLKRVRQGVFQNKGRVDTWMNYLTATGRKGANGQWYGSYLTELIHSPGGANATALDKGDKIRKVLQRTGIPADLKLQYKSFIPEGVETAWELLVHAKQRIKGLNYAEGNPLWNDYASILRRAVEMSPGRKRLQSAIDVLNQEIDFTGEALGAALSPSFSVTHGTGTSVGSRTLRPYVVTDGLGRQKVIDNPTGRSADPTRFGVFGGRTEPEVDARTGHQLDVRLNGRSRDVVTRSPRDVWNPFSRKIETLPGTAIHRPSPKIRGIDRWGHKRDEQGPSVASVLESGEAPLSRDIGDRTAFARTRVGRRNANLLGNDLLQHGPAMPGAGAHGGHFAGKVVQYNGLPYRITGIDAVTRRVTLTPISTNVELLATDTLRRPGASLNAVQKIGRRSSELPLAADAVAQQAGLDAKRTAEAIVARKTIAVRGGLLGATNDTVQVPMDLLREYMAGSSTFGDQQALQAAGFTGNADFAKRSRSFQKRFEAIVKKRLGTHPSIVAADLRGQAAEQRLEELTQGARIAVFEHLGGIQGGRSIQQIEEELIGIGVSRGPQFVLDATNSVVSQTFTELDRVGKGGAVESGFDRVSRIRAKGTLGLGQSFTTNTGERFIGKGRYVTTAEWQGSLEDFVGAIERRRASGESAGQILRGSFDEAFGSYGITNPKRVPGVIDQADQLVDLALNLRSDMNALGLRDPTVQRQKKDLLRSLGLDELRGTGRLDSMLARARETGNPEDIKTFLAAKASHIERVQERFLRRAHVLTRGTDLQKIGATEEGTTNPLGQAINKQNEEQYLDLFKAATELPVEQQGRALRDLGVKTTLVGDQQAAVLGTRSGQQFVLKEANGGMVAVHQNNPMVARFMGGAQQPFELGIDDIQKAIQAGNFEVSKRTAEETAASIKATTERTAREAFVRDYVSNPPAGLPIFKHGNSVVGFLESDLVNAQSVIENAKAAMEGKRALLFIDIETNREVNQITNFALRRLEKVDGVWTEVGGPVQLATPTLWEMGGVKGSAASRVAMRGGTTSIVNEVLANETALGNRAAELIGQHSDAIIIGHHVGFDIGKLAKVQGLEESAANIFLNAARNNVTDTLLLAQITHPGQTQYGLDPLGRTIAGQMNKEAHLALPDVYRNIEVFKEIAKRSDVAMAGLDALHQVKLNADSVLWTEQGGGRGFKVAGILDTEAASDAFFKQTGKNLGVGFGVALQPVDFRTGLPDGPFQLQFAQTPHGWAKSFAGQYEVLDPVTAGIRMEEKASDLARRRIRRAVSDEHAFTNLLAERKRMSLADAASRGPEALSEMQDLLAHRLSTTESEAEKGLLRGAYRYSQTFIQDSRIRRQLELERGFMQGEVDQMHGPVVNWLEKSLLDAPVGQVKTTREAVNRVWNDYMEQVNQAAPFRQMAVAEKPTIPLTIPILGQNAKALWTRDEASLRTSLQQRVLDIAKKLHGSQELDNLFIDASQSEINRVGTLIKHGENFLDTSLGPTVESHIFEHYIAPALDSAMVQLGSETKVPLKVRASNIEEAVSSILARTGEVVSQNKTSAADYLSPRQIPQDALEEIQKKIGVGGDIVARAEALASAENLKVALHHNAPGSWTGKRFIDLFETAANAGAEEQMQFTDRMRGLYKKMSSADQEVLSGIMQSKTPQWADEITAAARLPEVVQISKPVRDFNPGSLTNAGLQASETIAENSQAMKAMGLVGLGIIAVGIGIAARKPKASPNQTREDQESDQYLHSTELEVQKRKERVANQVPMVSKIAVNITADDPNGVSHEELTQSVHGALGTFLGREIHRAANVRDNRSRIDRDYLDRVAAQLLQKPTPVR